MKKIVVFTGAGVSADSGVATFRDANGLWANYRVEDVCTPEALRTNRAQVIEFYNLRRRESLTKKPNAGHIAIAEMEEWAEMRVEIIDQLIYGRQESVDALSQDKAQSEKKLYLPQEAIDYVLGAGSSFSEGKLRIYRQFAKNENADKNIAQAKAEERRAMAVALEQEMKAKAQEARARVIEAEAEVPLAMAEAFRSGNLGIMDYYKMKNIQADTEMRENIAKQ